MAKTRLDRFFNFLQRPLRAMSSMGVPGTALYGGYVVTREKSKDLASHEARHRTYAENLVNTSIIAAVSVKAYYQHLKASYARSRANNRLL